MNLPRLVFLGTGGDCEIIGRARTGAGILFQMAGVQLHIDPGPGALVRLVDYGFDPRSHTAILASNQEIAHAHDLPALISAMTLNGLDAKGILIAAKAVLEKLPEAYQRMCAKVLQAEPGKKFSIENIEISCLKTTNQSVGFRVLTPEFSFAYSSDTAFEKGLAKEYKADVLILNTLSYEPNKQGQLCAADSAKLIAKTKPKLAILTHFGLNFHNQNPIYAARELTKQTGVKVIAAEDGMILDTLDYSIKPAQKTLKRFTQAA